MPQKYPDKSAHPITKGHELAEHIRIQTGNRLTGWRQHSSRDTGYFSIRV